MASESKSNKTPISLFTYNRPAHTDKALRSLSKCYRLDECCLYIYCDGPKKPEHEASVESTREVVKEWAKKLNAEIVYREKNLGLSKSIVSGVTYLCKKYGKVIVLEDDLVVSPDFIDYMIQGLEKYQDETNVYQISGFMFPIENPDTPDAFFMPLTTTWGWATWYRAWKIFDWNAKGYKELLANKKTRNAFNLNGLYPYSKMLEDRMAGKNDSWGILWWYAVFQKQGLVLYPPISLVLNKGFDGSGIHCGNVPKMQYPKLYLNSQIQNHFLLPNDICNDLRKFELIKKRYFRRNKVDNLINIIKNYSKM